MVREVLSGWGRTAPTVAEVLHVEGTSGAVELVTELARRRPTRGAIARGLGRSYGDSSQNGGGVAIRLDGRTGEAADHIVLDAERGTVRAPAGISLDAVMRTLVPRGWFVPVTPGTRSVTVGGAIASDIHGKNHHVDGTFGAHVLGVELLLADGSVVTAGPARDAELFWATVGGMGLTGVILSAELRLLPIETSRCVVDTERVPDLDALLAHMERDDDAHRYSVAWIDLMARGASLGRSVLTRGDHARRDELTPRQARDPLAFAPGALLGVPSLVPRAGVLNRASIAAFNELWYRSAPARRLGAVTSIERFFHPLDGIAHWNRLYGRRGLVQYQFVVPFGAEATMRRVVERLSASATASFLAVLKRFGAANPAPLSFPTAGWTLALDLPAGAGGLTGLLAELDGLVLDAGGRHYLAKDGVTSPTAIARGYPRLAEWQAVQRRVDPHGLWQSDQSRRLQLTGTSRHDRSSDGPASEHAGPRSR